MNLLTLSSAMVWFGLQTDYPYNLKIPASSKGRMHLLLLFLLLQEKENLSPNHGKKIFLFSLI